MFSTISTSSFLTSRRYPGHMRLPSYASEPLSWPPSPSPTLSPDSSRSPSPSAEDESGYTCDHLFECRSEYGLCLERSRLPSASATFELCVRVLAVVIHYTAIMMLAILGQKTRLRFGRAIAFVCYPLILSFIELFSICDMYPQNGKPTKRIPSGHLVFLEAVATASILFNAIYFAGSDSSEIGGLRPKGCPKCLSQEEKVAIGTYLVKFSAFVVHLIFWFITWMHWTERKIMEWVERFNGEDDYTDEEVDEDESE